MSDIPTVDIGLNPNAVGVHPAILGEISQSTEPTIEIDPQTEIATSSTLSASYPQTVGLAVVASVDPNRNAVGQFVPGNTASNNGGAGGRPCSFCQNEEEYMNKATTYLDKCKKGVNGKPIMPYIEELALEMDTIDENLVNWANKIKKDTDEREHPKFFTIYSLVKMTQKFRLKQRALGRYNPAGALALLRFDHGAIDSSKQIIAGDKDEPLEIVITEDPTRTKYEGE